MFRLLVRGAVVYHHNAHLNNHYYALNYFTIGAYGHAHQKIAGWLLIHRLSRSPVTVEQAIQVWL
jgi:hypothetical protein